MLKAQETSVSHSTLATFLPVSLPFNGRADESSLGWIDGHVLRRHLRQRTNCQRRMRGSLWIRSTHCALFWNGSGSLWTICSPTMVRRPASILHTVPTDQHAYQLNRHTRP